VCKIQSASRSASQPASQPASQSVSQSVAEMIARHLGSEWAGSLWSAASSSETRVLQLRVECHTGAGRRGRDLLGWAQCFLPTPTSLSPHLPYTRLKEPRHKHDLIRLQHNYLSIRQPILCQTRYHFNPEDGGSTVLRNTGIQPQNYTAQ
jgi:hypothetical protein